MVREAPAEVCENCGEVYVAEKVTARPQIASEGRQAQAITLVRNYASIAA